MMTPSICVTELLIHMEYSCFATKYSLKAFTCLSVRLLSLEHFDSLKRRFNDIITLLNELSIH